MPGVWAPNCIDVQAKINDQNAGNPTISPSHQGNVARVKRMGTGNPWAIQAARENEAASKIAQAASSMPLRKRAWGEAGGTPNDGIVSAISLGGGGASISTWPSAAAKGNGSVMPLGFAGRGGATITGSAKGSGGGVEMGAGSGAQARPAAPPWEPGAATGARRAGEGR